LRDDAQRFASTGIRSEQGVDAYCLCLFLLSLVMSVQARNSVAAACYDRGIPLRMKREKARRRADAGCCSIEFHYSIAGLLPCLSARTVWCVWRRRWLVQLLYLSFLGSCVMMMMMLLLLLLLLLQNSFLRRPLFLILS